MLREHGKGIMCIDGTHNTTFYANTILTTLVVHDKWGHGVPVAWMLANSGTQATLSYFLSLVRQRSPTIISRFFMSDRDHAQINAICRIYPKSTVLLCWWHVLHAWQQHFHIPDHPELWELLKKWIRVKDTAEFNLTWAEIFRRAKEEFSDSKFYDYLHSTWMPENVVKMWSALYRCNRTIFKDCYTNMLIEA
jgi:hypothetical protein